MKLDILNKTLLFICSLLIIFSIILFNKFYNLNKIYSISKSNEKALIIEIDSSQTKARVLQLTVAQLNYFNDSLTIKLRETKKELGIKDSKIKQMQVKISDLEKEFELIVPDTIFLKPDFKLDTIMGDKWATNHIKMQYPNYVSSKPSFKLESYVFIESKKETIDPPKKFFLLRWFQKKHTVLDVIVHEKNPYSNTKSQRFVEIIK